MSRPHTITGIDIGNTQVKVAIAQIDRDALKPEIIGTGLASSNGLRRGMVVDMEESVANLSTAVQRAQAVAGVPIKSAYLAVNGAHIRVQTSRGVIAVSRADNEISQNDIDRVIQAASAVSLPANREVIHVIPRNYIIDGVEAVKNPLGMRGVRLEAEVFIIDGLSPYCRSLIRCVNENGIEVAGLVYAPLASALSALDKSQKEFGVMHLDFGGGTSSMTVFEEADLVHSAFLPIGSRHITNDLAVALRTSLDVAERIKLEHCSTSEIEDLRRRENVDLSQLLSEDNFIIPKKQLVKVVDARTNELLEMVTNELKKIGKHGLLPAGVVLSGGGSNLPGFAALVKEVLRLPVRVARSSDSEKISDTAFTVATGLILWGMEQEFNGSKPGGYSEAAFGGDGIKKITGWLKNFMP
ncbi:MAG: cell division protein FtsA [Candidatus Yanofskybacteria bacterium RIFCSPHIGHO2_01_FULL_45_42]|uniref:Cell division protein FtsA n=3 Tax=Candidatus Yanofskyibacteriota TaxID=1752733 RepID=A0A1F8F6S6_9BACT|nr:MAG: cell division protein FtsA [Candidatus Yanofskybacteria bacterium RIFCSPHIGHO2_01_FULL_45_42]OGN16365.1 MAG: cell division protein FtsA [Candidatus Yanofskybacteria bacterium RIFCSPHIGHO2_02_FULL_46_19]OGN26830.1 MAG: cell division protein FtsA [Candidatus Yanofskybacteria bacterium RIFCSPLOWO2_01_FULL_45_72]OGN32384.1 MAG: cell division protein FtsA [Candidatus Yanofskybacteria bacterium RIFCSPLOWO2_02_FULL_45_18]